MTFPGRAAAAVLLAGCSVPVLAFPATSRFDDLYPRGLRLETSDGRLALRLSALLQVDAATFDSGRRLRDDIAVRRGRLALGGRLAPGWSFRVESEMARITPLLNEAWLRRNGVIGGRLSVGFLKEPVGLEWAGSSRHLTFLERALPNALVPEYHVGARLDWSGMGWSAAVGAFGGGVDSDPEADDRWSVTGRVTCAPFHTSRRVLHVGLSGGHQEVEGGAGRLRLQTKPETHLATFNLVSTPTMRHITSRQLFGLEVAGVAGPWSLQAEYLTTFLQREGDRQTLAFDGWYVNASWILTGEARRYVAGAGSFAGVQPRRPAGSQGGWGAWEIAVRYSGLDLNDGGIVGGMEENLTTALNWYPADGLRLMANVIHPMTDDTAAGGRRAVVDEPRIFELRGQVEF